MGIINMAKKKDIINKIDATLYNHGLEDDDQMASKALLKMLIEAGMLPPNIGNEEAYELNCQWED